MQNQNQEKPQVQTQQINNESSTKNEKQQEEPKINQNTVQKESKKEQNSAEQKVQNPKALDQQKQVDSPKKISDKKRKIKKKKTQIKTPQELYEKNDTELQSKQKNQSKQEQIKTEKQSRDSPKNVDSMCTTSKTFKTHISTASKLNYKQNLSNLFQHYCKMSYATGKAPTFDQIHKKAHIMTINKFMIFSQDFGLRQRLSRDSLVNYFKNNASYYRHMNFGQFQLVLSEIASQIFKQFGQQKQFTKMLVFLRMHNSTAYTKKMNELGVIFRERNLKQKKQFSEYKFKLTPNNGKAAQQIVQQVQEKRVQRANKKQIMMKWHKINKQNKINKLYNVGASELGKNSKNLDKHYLEISRVNSENRNVYNPSVVITTLNSPKKYQSIYKQKKSKLKDEYDHLGHKIRKTFKEDLKINHVIKQAKKQIQRNMNDSYLSQRTQRCHIHNISQQISQMRIQSQIRTLGQEANRKTLSILKNEKEDPQIYKQLNDFKFLQTERDPILDQHLQLQARYSKK